MRPTRDKLLAVKGCARRQSRKNRVTSGLILAALIIGASLMMRIETPWTLFGYPGLAIVTFLAAAGGGFWLVINIFVQDKRSEHRAVNS